MLFSQMASNISCLVSPEFWFHKENAYFFSYYIVAPIYFILGICGHSICLLAFYKQAKKEPTYAYQIFVSLSETLEIIAFTLFSLSFRWWSGIENEGQDATWFVKNRSLMIYAAHLSFPMLNGILTTTLILSVCMSADRLLALWKPFTYKHFNHKRFQILSLITSLVVGMATSIFDGFRFKVVPNLDGINNTMKSDVTYRAIGDFEYMNSTTAIVLAHLRDALRISALIALVTCNYFITFFYRKRTLRMSSLTSTDGEREYRRRRKEKTLVLLTVSQSILTSVGTSFLIIFYAIVYAKPNFLNCGGLLMAPILDATLQLASILDIYIVIFIDRRFRKMVWRAIPVFVRRRFTRDAAFNKPTQFLMVPSPSAFSNLTNPALSTCTSRDTSAAASRRESMQIL